MWLFHSSFRFLVKEFTMSKKHNPSKFLLQKTIQQQQDVINDLVQEIYELKQKMKHDFNQELGFTVEHQAA